MIGKRPSPGPSAREEHSSPLADNKYATSGSVQEWFVGLRTPLDENVYQNASN